MQKSDCALCFGVHVAAITVSPKAELFQFPVRFVMQRWFDQVGRTMHMPALANRPGEVFQTKKYHALRNLVVESSGVGGGVECAPPRVLIDLSKFGQNQ